jgi:hypothetical protein
VKNSPLEALVPALIVAVWCLFRDEGLVSFLKKVGGTYLFFWLLSSLFGYFWRLASYRPAKPRKVKSKPAKAGK